MTIMPIALDWHNRGMYEDWQYQYEGCVFYFFRLIINFLLIFLWFYFFSQSFAVLIHNQKLVNCQFHKFGQIDILN